MEKKFYIQPQTERMAIALVGNIALTSLGVDNNSTDGMDGAPLRGFSGESLGLKYLI